MKTCTNAKCIALNRIVYSVATRCPLCRCDLRSVLPVSEASSSTMSAQNLPASH